MEFKSRNPLESAFWDERFDKGFTPWNRGAVPQNLLDYVEQYSADHDGDGQVCLIPGCGHAYELDFLISSAWQVTAIDFSPAAVAAAQTLFPSHAAAIVRADFFEYRPEVDFACIYERAFFCALPPERRAAVVQRWAQLLKSGGLVFGFFFIDEDAGDRPKGPPFRISSAQLSTLMERDFERVEDAEVCDSLAVFEGKERWQIWRRK